MRPYLNQPPALSGDCAAVPDTMDIFVRAAGQSFFEGALQADLSLQRWHIRCRGVDVTGKHHRSDNIFRMDSAKVQMVVLPCQL